jgi:hypothetical protein
VPAIRHNFKSQVAAGADQWLLSADPKSTMSWVRNNLEWLGDSALEQTVTVPWVREILRQSVVQTTQQSQPFLLSGIDFAFFEPYNRVLSRIGDLGHNLTHVRLTLEWSDSKFPEWKCTDIIRQ